MFSYMKRQLFSKGVVVAMFCLSSVIVAQPATAVEISFRSFSGAGAIGPPADAFSLKLEDIILKTLGDTQAIKFTKISPSPAIPAEFGGSVVAAVAAGGSLTGGTGFDAAYISGESLNPAWGFIFNSGVPFGPNFDEFMGFLYGKNIADGEKNGLDLLQETLDKRGKNIVAIPIVGSSQQGSGYFMKPVGPTQTQAGIGLTGLCQEPWTFRYLPPAQHVLDLACDNLVAEGVIPQKNIDFVTAVGGGAILQKIIDGEVQAFEFATPLDDITVLFSNPEINPGTVGAKYLHYPGWHQPFLVTYMIINKQVWNMLSEAQQTMITTVARDSIVSSYGENLRQQGGKLQEILNANSGDGDFTNDVELVRWPDSSLSVLKDATIEFLNERHDDQALNKDDRKDYKKILKKFRQYVNSNNGYWKRRDVPSTFRFVDWYDQKGKKSWDQVFE